MKPTSLKNTLRLNALVTSLFITILLLFNGPIAELLGSIEPIYLAYIAYGLIGFVALVLSTSEQKQTNVKLVTLIAYLDKAWVIASILLLLFANNRFTIIGMISIALVALVVAIFAYYEVKGIKQMDVKS